VNALKIASEVQMHQSLAEHEAAHVSAALVLGVPVVEVHAPYRTLEDRMQRMDRGEQDAGMVTVKESDPRKLALVLLVAPFEDGDAHWPPSWPLPSVPAYGDEADLCRHVKALGLDRAGYHALIQEALELAMSDEYRRLHVAFTHALERHGRLDAEGVRLIQAASEDAWST
jgi:hypothetical protein